jgi:competence protein ComEA
MHLAAKKLERDSFERANTIKSFPDRLCGQDWVGQVYVPIGGRRAKLRQRPIPISCASKYVYDFSWQLTEVRVPAQALILHGFSGDMAMRLSLGKVTGFCSLGCVLLLGASALTSQTTPPPASAPPAASAPAAQSAPANPVDEWPDGPGKAIFLQTCSNCHTPENVLGHNLDSDGWTDLLNRMIQFGAQGSDDDFGAILSYLTTNFGPAPPKVNINKATAMNLRNWLGMPQKEAQDIVDYRTQHGDFKSLDDVKKVPNVDLKFLDSVKDNLTY